MFIEYILPPIVGAITGYITNAIAIRMLFKPHNPIKIAKMKIPLTPGLIPKKRQEITRSIGKFVENVIADEDILRDKLDSKEIHNAINISIKNIWNNIYTKEWGRLDGYFKNKTIIDLYTEKLSNLITSGIVNIIRDEHSYKQIDILLDGLMDKWLEKPIGDIIKKDEAKNVSSGAIKAFTNTEDLDSMIGKILNEVEINLRKSNEKISVYVKNIDNRDLINWIKQRLPEITDNLTDILKEEQVQRQIKDHFNEIIQSFLDDLGGIRKFMINISGITNRIDEYFPKLMNKLFDELHKQSFQDSLMNSFEKYINNYLESFKDKSISELLNLANKEWLSYLKNNVNLRIGDYLKSDNFNEYAGNFIGDYLDSVQNETIKDYINNKLMLSDEEIKIVIKNMLWDFIQSDEFTNKINQIAKNKLEYLVYNQSFKSLQDYFPLNEKQQESIHNGLSELVLGKIKDSLGEILKSIDLKNITETKLNQLPIKRLEDLILIVIKKHLKYINLFGALLGSILGTFQVVMNLLK